MQKKDKQQINKFFDILKPKSEKTQSSPLFQEGVQAGFPSPAEDFVEGYLDLNQYLIQHPSATFFVRARGDSMINAGIYDGDILVVDRALDAKNNDIVIASVFGEFTLKRLIIEEDKIVLMPENPEYSPIEILPDSDFRIWGVVTSVIHKLQ